MTQPARAPEVDLPPAPRNRAAKIKYLAFAIVFFLLGVVGLIIPVMPQIVFFAISLIFFSMISPPVRRRVRKFLQTHPRMAAAYKKWRDRGRQKRQRLIKKKRAIERKLHIRRES
jgi:uncharacterized membrane protein YbaN (DUF454 family)